MTDNHFSRTPSHRDSEIDPAPATPIVLPTALHIEGRRWFQRTAGNTYHSVRIFANGALLASLPYQYGYGDQWIETALQWLHANGHIRRERYDNGSYKESGTLYLRESLGATYSVIDVARQKDL